MFSIKNLIIGGVAGGVSATARLRRLDNSSGLNKTSGKTTKVLPLGLKL